MATVTKHGAVVTPEEDRAEMMEALRSKVAKLTSDLASATDEGKYWESRAEDYRKNADKNAENGAAWKKVAEEREKELSNLRAERDNLLIEAAELRGYIHRVRELDPADVQERRINMPDLPMGRKLWPSGIDEMMRRY